jgi:hypothetical protein
MSAVEAPPWIARGSSIAVCIAISAILFMWGLAPGYLFELEGQLSAPSERCPEVVRTGQGYDAECVAELIERGPLYLGKEALVGSFVAGLAAIAGLSLAADRRWMRRTAIASVVPMFLFGWLAAIAGAGAEFLLAAGVGWIAVVAISFVRRVPVRIAVMVFLALYLSVWTILLIWNDAEGDRLAPDGSPSARPSAAPG